MLLANADRRQQHLSSSLRFSLTARLPTCQCDTHAAHVLRYLAEAMHSPGPPPAGSWVRRIDRRPRANRPAGGRQWVDAMPGGHPRSISVQVPALRLCATGTARPRCARTPHRSRCGASDVSCGRPPAGVSGPPASDPVRPRRARRPAPGRRGRRRRCRRRRCRSSRSRTARQASPPSGCARPWRR